MTARALVLDFEDGEEKTNAEMLEGISAQIDEMAEQDEWSPKLLYLVQLCLEELAINAMTYGRRGGLSEFQVSITPGVEEILVELHDDGAAFDPTKDAPIPDPDAPMEDRPIGGLGIFLIREMVDDLVYRREEGWNHLTITIRRAQ
ncbi:MAG: ATP-binding protein [Acidimicrobiia bacterium]|nr:ATP-binding protein [bacterium]MXZ69680.1 ATP-binding protein [Acidimicrobiia bacterium]MYB45069.1 ATP-binding protein [Acidimicrobiia bacterium]MYC86317.1 ATP-binding protein [Acidimicrobiia bacterium]